MSAADERDCRRLLREMAALTAENGGGAAGDIAADEGEFLFDDGLYVRLRPAAAAVLVEAYLLDMSLITGPARNLLFHAIGQCNAVGAAGRPFAVGMDEREYILLYRRLPLAGLTAEGLLAEMSYLVEQGRDVRALLTRLAFGTLPAPASPSVAGSGA